HYSFVNNSPLLFLDPDGKDRIEYIRTIGKDGTVLLEIRETQGLFKAVHNSTYSGLGYFTKNDYAVYTTIDYRSGEKVTTQQEEILYKNSEKIGFTEYLKIKATGKEGEIKNILPQLFIFGSGRSDPGWGSEADPDRPITVIDFAAFESIMKLITLGKAVPDLRGADPEKIPEMMEKARSFDVNRKGKEESKI